MNQIINTYKRNFAEKRMAVIRLEVDYELLVLHEALLDDNKRQIEKSKRQLEVLRKEMNRLKG